MRKKSRPKSNLQSYLFHTSTLEPANRTSESRIKISVILTDWTLFDENTQIDLRAFMYDTVYEIINRKLNLFLEVYF